MFMVDNTIITEVYLDNNLIIQLRDKANTIIWNRYDNCMFYGGITITPAATNITTIISNANVLTVIEKSAGTAREYPGGTACGINALFYGGTNQGNTAWFDQLTLIDKAAVIVGTETSLGTARGIGYGGARANRNALFYGGTSSGTFTNRLTIFNESLSLVQNETTIGTILDMRIGVENGLTALYFSGKYYGTNTYTILSDVGAVIALEAYNLSSIKSAGSSVGINSLFVSGTDGGQGIFSLLSPTGTLLKPEVTISGTMKRGGMAGGFAGINALFYGGLNATTYVNFCDSVTESLTIIGTEKSIGTARQMMGSGSI